MLSLLKQSFKKETLRILNLYLPSQNSSQISNLNAVLGQAGINSFDFSKKFNELSKIYTIDVMLKVQLKVYIDKTFDIYIERPFISFLILEETNLIDNSISINSVYKISNILLFLKNENVSLKSILNEILGTLKSMKISIKKI